MVSPAAKKLKSPLVAQVVKAKSDKTPKASKPEKAIIEPSPKAAKVIKGLDIKASGKPAKAPKIRETAPAAKESVVENPDKGTKKQKNEKATVKSEVSSASVPTTTTTSNGMSPLDKNQVTFDILHDLMIALWSYSQGTFCLEQAI